MNPACFVLLIPYRVTPWHQASISDCKVSMYPSTLLQVSEYMTLSTCRRGWGGYRPRMLIPRTNISTVGLQDTTL